MQFLDSGLMPRIMQSPVSDALTCTTVPPSMPTNNCVPTPHSAFAAAIQKDEPLPPPKLTVITALTALLTRIPILNLSFKCDDECSKTPHNDTPTVDTANTTIILPTPSTYTFLTVPSTIRPSPIVPPSMPTNNCVPIPHSAFAAAIQKDEPLPPPKLTVITALTALLTRIPILNLSFKCDDECSKTPHNDTPTVDTANTTIILPTPSTYTFLTVPSTIRPSQHFIDGESDTNSHSTPTVNTEYPHRQPSNTTSRISEFEPFLFEGNNIGRYQEKIQRNPEAQTKEMDMYIHLEDHPLDNIFSPIDFQLQNSPNTKNNNKYCDVHNNKLSFQDPLAAVDKSKTMDLSRKADKDPEKEKPSHSGKFIYCFMDSQQAQTSGICWLP